MPVLTAIDVLGVQRFIFQSNRLRDVVTGSFLVHWSTSLEGALKDFISTENVLLAGGANVVVNFNSIEEARSFAARFTRLLHDKAPGLEVVVVHRGFDKGSLAQALQEIQIELARAKTERSPSVPLWGLSVTESCGETGLPANGFDRSDPTVPLSKEILKRREKKDEAKRHWSEYLKGRNGTAFPMELDHLGRDKDNTSLIGVVHIDGNGVGEKIKNWLKEKSENGIEDDVVRREYLEWSHAIDDLGKKSFQAVVDRVWQAIDQENEWKISAKPVNSDIKLMKSDDEWMLPLRPILLGGDDLTFVCDGRIALDLAETALDVFDKSDVPHLGKIGACAGVAMVRVHAPFARAYDLAENLCATAKRMLKERNETGCAMDWHIGACRPRESVDDIRKRQYLANDKTLTCRPYRLGSGREDAETWRWLSGTLLNDPQTGLRGKVWSKRRNKVKALAELAREGPESVSAALKAWKVVDTSLQFPQPIEGNGFFAQKRTPLIDALELFDLHLMLDAAKDSRREGEKSP